MADAMRITNMPESGSQERVAFDLANLIIFRTEDRFDTRAAILDLYAECLTATRKLGSVYVPRTTT